MRRCYVLLVVALLCVSLGAVVQASGGVMYSVYGKVNVDGDLSEWRLEYPIVLSPDNPDWYDYLGWELAEKTASDFSGTLYSAWDEDYVYFCGVIKDNDTSSTTFWNCDFWGFYFDALGITSPGDPSWMEGHIWAHWRPDPAVQNEEIRAVDSYMGRSHDPIPGSKGIATFNDDGYVFEIMIPWKELAFLEEPYESKELCFRMIGVDVDLVLGYLVNSQYIWGAEVDYHEDFWKMGTLKLIK